MKLLKASFLLAAAATATQLDATDYRIEWSGASYGNVATARAIVGLDLTGANLAGNNFWHNPPNAHVLSFNMTISGNSLVSLNKSYTASDVTSFVFGQLNNGETMSSDLVAQGGGNFPGWLDLRVNSPIGGALRTYQFMMYSSIGDFTGYGDSMKLVYFGPNGVTDVVAWMSSINGANRTYMIGSTLAGLPLEGAHHRPMLSFDRMGKESQAWATGDFGSSSNTRDVHVTSGEAGINWNLGKSFLVGVAGGHAVQNQELAFGGSSATGGDFAIAELDYRPEGTQWIVSLLGMVGSWESKTHRGYTGGGSTDSSFGVADTITRSARLRVDAPSLVTFGGFGFAPYASYTVTQTVVGAYAETGGALPASFDEQAHNATEGRVGITASKDLSAATKLLLSVEAIHRFDGVGPRLTGQDITGGVSFDLAGTAPRADSVRFGFDVDHKLNENTLLNVSAHVATVGEEHDVSAAISIRRAF